MILCFPLHGEMASYTSNVEKVAGGVVIPHST
jgi:hypothetical protein